jgi:hypothetical protein
MFVFCIMLIISRRMGAGKKTQTENEFRELPEKELGGVVFCCNNNTFDECFTKQLFG